jgi:hypothetical protein
VGGGDRGRCQCGGSPDDGSGDGVEHALQRPPSCGRRAGVEALLGLALLEQLERNHPGPLNFVHRSLDSLSLCQTLDQPREVAGQVGADTGRCGIALSKLLSCALEEGQHRPAGQAGILGYPLAELPGESRRDFGSGLDQDGQFVREAGEVGHHGAHHARGDAVPAVPGTK